MEITDVKVFPRMADGIEEKKLKAYASITFDSAFVVRGLQVIDGKDGLFVVMPGKKSADGMFRDIAHPLNSDMRRGIEEKVLDKFLSMRQVMGSMAQ